MDYKKEIKFEKYKKMGAYHWQYYRDNPIYQKRINRTLSYFPIKGTLLDIGCGDGLISYLLFKKGLKVEGIDPDKIAINSGWEKIIEQYKKNNQYNLINFLFLQINNRKIIKDKGLNIQVKSIYNYSAQKFDYVLCHEVIEHVPKPEKLIEIANGIAKKFVLFSTPNGKYQEKKKYDYQLWNLDYFLKLFKGYSVDVLENNKIRIVVRLNRDEK